MKLYPILFTSAVCITTSFAASTIEIGVANNTALLKNINGNPLSAGTAASGDGAVVQIGYYTLSATLNPFAGDWVAMTGPGTSYLTTIGDSGNRAAGELKFGVLFTEGSLGFVAPAVGTPLAMRFYDSTSIASSTYFNAVADTSGAFTWVAPTDPKSTTSLSFLTVGVVWQGGAGSAYKTTLAVPEPSSLFLAGLGLISAVSIRRR